MVDTVRCYQELEYDKSRICLLFEGDSGLKSYIERIRVTFVSELKAY